MPKGSVKKTAERCGEIIGACERLYDVKGLREVTIKEIGEMTSFSRPSIYNYFETKEEIFLALLQREYDTWSGDLDEIPKEHESMSAGELARAIADTLDKRTLMLKIQAMDLYEIEENSRVERLVDFKHSFFRAMNAFDACLIKFMPDMTESERGELRYSFFPFMYGIYPYAFPTDKQRRAMDAAGISCLPVTVGDMAFHCLKKLLYKDDR